jgi:hypothetical protein
MPDSPSTPSRPATDQNLLFGILALQRPFERAKPGVPGPFRRAPRDSRCLWRDGSKWTPEPFG